jgi:hypothetical protein
MTEDTTTADLRTLDADPRARFRTLPSPVRLADTVETHDAFPPAPDPAEAQDPNRAAALRWPL